MSHGDIANRVPLTGSGDDLDKVAAQINATLAHLQKLIESVNQASSDIAHDLKKPIGRLRRRLEEALSAKGDPKEFRGRVEESLEELDSIVETFEALLRITQLEAGARKARFCDVDLGSVLAEVADIYEPVVEEAGDSLESAVPTSLKRADPGRPRAADAALCQPDRERHPPLAEGHPHRGEPLEPSREVRGGRVGHGAGHPDR